MREPPWISELPAARPSSAPRAAGWARPARARWPKPAARSCSTAATPRSWRRPPPRSPSLTGAKIIRGRRRRRDAGGPEGAARRLPAARHPGQQQCRPADARFPRAHAPADDRRRHRQHDRGDRADPEGDRPDERSASFGRIVNITSGSVKMPLAGLDLSSGARAGLTAFLAGVARTVAAKQRHHQQHPARRLRHRPAARRR